MQIHYVQLCIHQLNRTRHYLHLLHMIIHLSHLSMEQQATSLHIYIYIYIQLGWPTRKSVANVSSQVTMIQGYGYTLSPNTARRCSVPTVTCFPRASNDFEIQPWFGLYETSVQSLASPPLRTWNFQNKTGPPVIPLWHEYWCALVCVCVHR